MKHHSVVRDSRKCKDGCTCNAPIVVLLPCHSTIHMKKQVLDLGSKFHF